MGRRTRLESLGYRLGFGLAALALEAALRILPHVPVAWLVFMWEGVWRSTFRVQRRRVERMEANLAAALGDRFPSRAERRRLVRESWRHLHRSVLDAVLAVVNESERERLRRIPVEGMEHLEAAVARGRGVLVLSAHLGGFTMVPIRLATIHPVSLVVNRPDDDRVAACLDECRARVSIGSVPVRPSHAAARASLAALREGRMLVILADEFKAGGVPVEFFGHPASAPRGPVALALRTGAALLPVFALRDTEDQLRLEIGAEIELARSGDAVEDVAINTARVCEVIERQVGRTPAQWNWANFRIRARSSSPKFDGRHAGVATKGASSV